MNTGEFMTINTDIQHIIEGRDIKYLKLTGPPLDYVYANIDKIMNESVYTNGIITGQFGWIARATAYSQRDLSLLKAFLEFIQDRTSKEKRDALVGHDSLLLWACDKGMPNMAQALLAAGADPNVADVNGDTPLLVACDRGLAESALRLIGKNANVNVKNKINQTPITISKRNRSMASVVTALTKSTIDHPTISDNIISTFKKIYTIFTTFFDGMSQTGTTGVVSKKVFDNIGKGEYPLISKFNTLYPTLFTTQAGGAIVTYTTKTENIEGNMFMGIPNRPNILILGGGPNGLYTAILLKLAMPYLEVNVVEKRVSEDGLRTLSRDIGIDLSEGTLKKNDDVDAFTNTIKVTAPDIYSIFTNSGTESVNLFLHMWDSDPRANIHNIELKYGNKAQTLGANIYHDSTVGKDIAKYVNDETLCIFDATGGRYTDKAQFWRTKAIREGPSTKFSPAFTVYEGYLPLEDSITTIKGVPYVGIGDTVIKVDYKNIIGLHINGLLILMYVLALTQIAKAAAVPAAAAGPYVENLHPVNTGPNPIVNEPETATCHVAPGLEKITGGEYQAVSTNAEGENKYTPAKCDTIHLKLQNAKKEWGTAQHTINVNAFNTVYITSDIHSDVRKFLQLLLKEGFVTTLGSIELYSKNPEKDPLYSFDIIEQITWSKPNTLLIIVGDLVDGRRVPADPPGVVNDTTGRFELLLHILLFNLRIDARGKDMNSDILFTIGNHDYHSVLKNNALFEYVDPTVMEYFGNRVECTMLKDGGAIYGASGGPKDMPTRQTALTPFYELSPYITIRLMNGSRAEIVCVHASLHTKEGIQIDVDKHQTIINRDGLVPWVNDAKSKLDELWSRVYADNTLAETCALVNNLNIDMVVVGHCPVHLTGSQPTIEAILQDKAYDFCENNSGLHLDTLFRTEPKTGNTSTKGCVAVGCANGNGPRIAFVDTGMSQALRNINRQYMDDIRKLRKSNGSKFTDEESEQLLVFINKRFNETRNSEFLLLEHDATLDSSKRHYNKISRKPAGSPAIPVWSSPKKSTGGRRLRLKPAAE